MTALQLLRLLIPELSDTMATVSLYAAIVMALVTCFFGYLMMIVAILYRPKKQNEEEAK